MSRGRRRVDPTLRTVTLESDDVVAHINMVSDMTRAWFTEAVLVADRRPLFTSPDVRVVIKCPRCGLRVGVALEARHLPEVMERPERITHFDGPRVYSEKRPRKPDSAMVVKAKNFASGVVRPTWGTVALH